MKALGFINTLQCVQWATRMFSVILHIYNLKTEVLLKLHFFISY